MPSCDIISNRLSVPTEPIRRIPRVPIISVSTDLKKMLERNYKVPEDRITVVNNGINIGKFESLSVNEKEILKKKWEC